MKRRAFFKAIAGYSCIPIVAALGSIPALANKPKDKITILVESLETRLRTFDRLMREAQRTDDWMSEQADGTITIHPCNFTEVFDPRVFSVEQWEARVCRASRPRGAV